MCLFVVCGLLCDVVWCVFDCFVCVCAVFARFVCDVWRDGVWFVVCCCFCLCALLLIRLCNVCVIYCLLYSVFCACFNVFV